MPYISPIDAYREAENFKSSQQENALATALKEMQVRKAQQDAQDAISMRQASRSAFDPQTNQFDFGKLAAAQAQMGNIEGALKIQQLGQKATEQQALKSILSGGTQAAIAAPGGQTINPSTTPAPSGGSVNYGAPQQPAEQQAPAAKSPYQKYMEAGNQLLSRGMTEPAKQLFDLAKEVRPELKEQKVLVQNGKRIVVNYYKDGTREIQPFDPDQEKLHFADTGGRSAVTFDPFSGAQVGAGVQRTMTPGEMATNAREIQANEQGKWKYDPETGMSINAISGQAKPIITASGMPLEQSKKLTESQANVTGYGMRAAEAANILEDLGNKGVYTGSLIKQGLEGTPLIGGALGITANALVASTDEQKVEQAQRNFINAVLRRESGAVISADEFANAKKQYFPIPGEPEEVRLQKRQNMSTTINALRIGAGPGAKNIPSYSPGQTHWKDQYKSKAQAVQDALEAVRQGAPREAVRQRLKDIGISDARI
jgi:hypothetical protein